MIGHRILTIRKVGGGKGPIALNLKWLMCQSCRELHKRKRLAKNESPFLWTPIKVISKTGTDDKLYFPFEEKYDPMKIVASYYNTKTFNKGESFSHMDPHTAISSVNENSNLFFRHSYIKAMDETVVFPKGFGIGPNDNIQNNSNKKSSNFHEHGENKCRKSKRHKENLSRNVQYFSVSKSHKLKMSKVKKIKKLPGTEELILEKVLDNVLEEWPNWFENKGSFGLDYVSDSILFDNAVLGIKTKGSIWYKFQLHCFKWTTKLVWFEPQLQVIQITKHANDNTVKVRWLIKGKPRILYPMLLIGRAPSLRYMDFFSILTVGQDEKINAHRLTKLVPRQSTQKRNPLISLLTLFGLAGRNIPEFQEKPILPSSSESGS